MSTLLKYDKLNNIRDLGGMRSTEGGIIKSGKLVRKNGPRILLTHATDLQDTGTTYEDGTKTGLVKWGRLPHLMRAGRAEVTLRLSGAARPKVYALASDGSRRGEVESSFVDGALSFTADTARDRSDATFLYEIVR